MFFVYQSVEISVRVQLDLSERHFSVSLGGGTTRLKAAPTLRVRVRVRFAFAV